MSKIVEDGNSIKNNKEANKTLEKLRAKTIGGLKTMTEMKNVLNPSDHFDSGSALFNIFLGGHHKKGMPNNVGVSFIGGSGSGKSFATLLLMRAAVKKGYLIMYYETEGAISTDKMAEFGIDTDMVIVIDNYNHLVDLRDLVVSQIDALGLKDNVMFVYDSLYMVLGSEEYNKIEDTKKSEFSPGKPAQERNTFFKATYKKCCRKHLPQIVVNREHANIGGVTNPKYAKFNEKNIIAGGGAMHFGPEMILRWKCEQITEDRSYEDEFGKKIKEKITVGTKFIFESRKARTTINEAKGYFIIDKDGKLLRYSGLKSYAVEFGAIEISPSKIKKGNKHVVHFNGEEYRNFSMIPDESWDKLLDGEFGDWLHSKFNHAKVAS